VLLQLTLHDKLEQYEAEAGVEGEGGVEEPFRSEK